MSCRASSLSYVCTCFFRRGDLQKLCREPPAVSEWGRSTSPRRQQAFMAGCGSVFRASPAGSSGGASSSSGSRVPQKLVFSLVSVRFRFHTLRPTAVYLAILTNLSSLFRSRVLPLTDGSRSNSPRQCHRPKSPRTRRRWGTVVPGHVELRLKPARTAETLCGQLVALCRHPGEKPWSMPFLSVVSAPERDFHSCSRILEIEEFPALMCRTVFDQLLR